MQTQRDLRYKAGMGSKVQTQQRDLLRYIAREGSEVQTQRDLRSIKGGRRGATSGRSQLQGGEGSVQTQRDLSCIGG